MFTLRYFTVMRATIVRDYDNVNEALVLLNEMEKKETSSSNIFKKVKKLKILKKKFWHLHARTHACALTLIHTHLYTTSPPRADLNLLTHFIVKGGPSIFQWSALRM